VSLGVTEAGPNYREIGPIAALRPHVSALWVRGPGRPDAYNVVVPDGCMDIVWQVQAGLLIAGPATRPIEVSAPAAGYSIGIRFRPGIAPSFLKTPASEFRDAHVALAAIWPREARRLSESGDGLSNPGDRLRLLQEIVAGRLEDSIPDDLVKNAVAMVQNGRSRTVEQLAEALATSERHLLRRLVAAVGYGPKTLQRILRFRRSLQLLRKAPPGSLTDVALSAGYADLPHMTREYVRLCGISPHRLARVGNKSDSFKPHTLRRSNLD